MIILSTFARHAFEPLNSIKQRPYHFVVWWIVANLFGLAGFWLPLLLVKISGGPAGLLYESLIDSGSLASFSVIILADGIAAAILTTKTGSNPNAAGIRGLFSTLAIMLAMVQVGILVFSHAAPASSRVYHSMQFFLTLLAILFGSYLYCFRYAEWEKGVDEVAAEENAEVGMLGQAAKGTSADGHGVKL